MKTIIFSIDRPNIKNNYEEYIFIKGFLKQSHINVAEGCGSYNGDVEKIYICKNVTQNQERLICEIAKKYEQECILHIDNSTDKCWLDFLDNVTKRELGLFKIVDDCFGEENFTLDYTNNTFYKAGA